MKKQITKTYLEYLGVTEVTTDGRIFTKKGELKPFVRSHGNRLAIMLHDQEKYKSVPKEKRNNSSGQVIILVHQVVYAWFNSEVPYGKELHHIDMNYLNNSIDNLEALTHEEHKAKHSSTVEEKCRLDIPREHYLKKIAEYEAKGALSNAAQYKRRLRYYDSHIEEFTKQMEFKKDCMELASWKRVFRDNNGKSLWHECCTIEKMVKEKGIEARPAVTHALEVIHMYFNKEV